MSCLQRMSIQQRRGKRYPKLENHQQSTLRQTLIERAHKLKQKIAQQTNTFDYSVQKLMNQTLKQVKQYKSDFLQKQKQLALIYKDEEYERKKTLLKNQLQNQLQICKQKYKQTFSLIKNKKSRIYTSIEKNNQQKVDMQEMLKTAKNKFKFQCSEQKYKQRNKSQIIHLKKISQQEITNQIKRNYHGQSSSKLYSKKRNHDNISIDMIKARETKKFQDSFLIENKSNQYFSPEKFYATQKINVSSQQSKKSLLQTLIKKKKDNQRRGYSKFSQQKSSNAQNISNSQRSLFIPMGKVALRNQRKRMITDFEQRNINEKEKNKIANKLSTDIVAEFVEIQLSQNTGKKNYLPLNKRLKTDQSLQFKTKNYFGMENGFTGAKESMLDEQQFSKDINTLKSYKKDEMSPKSGQFLYQKQRQNEQHACLEEIQCAININELRIQNYFQQKQEDQEIRKSDGKSKKIGQNSNSKSILFNRKENQLSRKLIRNHLNSRQLLKKTQTKAIMRTQQVLPFDSKNSGSMILDIKGNHIELQQSYLKNEKVKRFQSIQSN